MDILLFAFANDRTAPLQSLADEYMAINRLLSPRVLRQHFMAWSMSHTTRKEMTYYLTQFRERLQLFQFSGHAGAEQLLLEDGSGRSQGVAALLGQCPNLQVVILNGCSTRGLVDVLQEQGIPLIIATSAPVEDRSAATFSEHLHQALETGQTIQQAFDLAVGAIQLEKELVVYRDLGSARKRATDEPLWGIFTHPDHPQANGWKLPSKTILPPNPNYVANEVLLDTLYETFAQTNPFVHKIYQPNKPLDLQNESAISTLLKALPAPISEHVRKLVSPMMDHQEEAWSQVSEMRLHQISQTYQITMDFLVFTLLAQIWEMFLRTDWEPNVGLRKEIHSFLHLGATERADYDYFSFIRQLREAFPAESSSLFIQEFDQLRTAFLQDETIENACFFLETLRRQMQTASALDMMELCERSEKALATIFGQMGYLGRYILATVRNINIHKYRHMDQAEFEHLVMKWYGVHGQREPEYRRQADFMDNRSVVLLRWGDQPDDNRFLNLSPFILDENTFEAVPDLKYSKLYFFARKEGETLYYKFVRDPEEDVINLDDPKYIPRRQKESKFQMAKAQFTAFFNQFVLNEKPDQQ